jgi:hypothetical protein
MISIAILKVDADKWAADQLNLIPFPKYEEQNVSFEQRMNQSTKI